MGGPDLATQKNRGVARSANSGGEHKQLVIVVALHGSATSFAAARGAFLCLSVVEFRKDRGKAPLKAAARTSAKLEISSILSQ